MQKLILAVNSFQYPIALGPNYTKEDATIEILVMLFSAFILGFLFRHFIGFRKKEYIIESNEEGTAAGLSKNLNDQFEKECQNDVDKSRSDIDELKNELFELKKEMSRISMLKLGEIKGSTLSSNSTQSQKPNLEIENVDVKAGLIHSPAIDSVKVDEINKEEPIPIVIENSTVEVLPIVDTHTTHTTVPEDEDLKVIEGIGPAIEKLLNDKGIRTYNHLANESVARLEQILDEAGPRFRVHVPETWPQQARLLRDNRIEEFKALADSLRGGRKL